MAERTSGAQQLARALSAMDIVQVIEHTLAVISGTSKLCRRLLHHCYVHGNGFEAYQLHAPDIGSDGDLVVHIWPPRAALRGSHPTTTDVHDHRWDLASYIVRGCLEMRLLEATDDTSHLHYTHRRNQDWGHSFELLRRSGVRPLDNVVIDAGETYALASTILHEVRAAPDVTTVTVMLRGPEQRPATNVLSRSSKKTTATVEQPRLPQAYVRRRLELVARDLDRAVAVDSSTAICR